MNAQAQGQRDEGWTIERAENLLGTLTGVISVRIVCRPGGEVEEIHLLTTEEVSPKQTVRNVESALRAHFDLTIDHRKVSVAQTSDPAKQEAAESDAAGPQVLLHPAPRPGDGRILFIGHQVETERSHRVRIRVTIEWNDEVFEGEAVAADLPRARLEAIANATLQAVERALAEELKEAQDREVTMALDGVKLVDAFDRTFVMVAVHAIHGREITALAGAAGVDDTSDRAVILATLQATDRWVRGRI